MAIGSGISAQIMVAEEVTWGTAVTTTRGLEFVSESLTRDQERIESEGIRAGQTVMRSDDWTTGAEKVAGSIEVDLTTKNMALLFKHLFGTPVTAGAGPYTHTFTPGDITGKGLTVQVGKPDVAGTVQPFTYAGCKVKSVEISCTAGSDEPAKVTVELVAKSETTATALAAASYTASVSILAWVHLVVSIAGSAVPVRDFSIKFENELKDDRYQGGVATIDEPVQNGLRTIDGSVTIDFSGLTQYARYTGGTEAAMVATFTRGADSIAITLNARFDGETPEVDDRDLIELEVPFMAIATGADSTACTVVVTSAEATP